MYSYFSRKKPNKMRKEGRIRQKVPKSVLMTQEEKENFQRIQEMSEKRNQEILEEPVMELDENMSKIHEYIDYDLFIQILDKRDTESSRCLEVEEFLKSVGKKVQNFLTDNKINKKIFKGKKVVIFGRKNTGKFLFSKKIEDICTVSIVEIASTEVRIYEILKNTAAEGSYDPIFTFMDLMPFINPSQIRDFYCLREFSDVEDFMTLLGKKVGNEKKNRRIMSAGAKQVIKDIQNEKIKWVKEGEKYTFSFE